MTKALVADWAHPASHNANLEPLVEGPAISLPAIHAKVRRQARSTHAGVTAFPYHLAP